MKKIPCSNPTCNQRRRHHETPDENRETVMCYVPDDHVGVAFCSITCACYAGYYNVQHGWVRDPKDGSVTENGDNTRTTLSAENARRFLDIIEQDEPNDALKKAAKKSGGQ